MSDETEKPARRRSPMWASAARIRELVLAGYSYAQVSRMLKLEVSASRLGKWCRTAGIVPPKPHASRPPPPATAEVEAKPEKAQARSISEVLDEEQRAQRSSLSQFFKSSK